MTSDDLITATEAGRLLDKSARTVSRLAETGQLPFVQKLAGPRGAYLFKRSAIQAEAEKHRASA
jgi:hypothetical protein